MGKTVNKVITHGKNVDSGDFLVMVCPECAALYENKSPTNFTEKHKLYIKKGRQVTVCCNNCNCQFERKVYDKTIIRWKKVIPVALAVIALIMFILFVIGAYTENEILLVLGLITSTATGGVALCNFMDVEIF